jgi:hypothetical protein
MMQRVRKWSDIHSDDGIGRPSTSGTVRNTAQVDELILENRAVNITDLSTALELPIGTVRAIAQ